VARQVTARRAAPILIEAFIAPICCGPCNARNRARLVALLDDLEERLHGSIDVKICNVSLAPGQGVDAHTKLMEYMRDARLLVRVSTGLAGSLYSLPAVAVNGRLLYTRKVPEEQELLQQLRPLLVKHRRT